MSDWQETVKRAKKGAQVKKEGVERERGDVRSKLNEDLDGWFDEETRRFLFEEVLAATKKVNVQCPHCNRMLHADVPDARAVTPMIMEMLNQAKGRPGQSEGETGPRIMFTRTVVYKTEENGPVADVA